jgi:regulator of sirC expression with transglutaminase-like and TPR domain
MIPSFRTLAAEPCAVFDEIGLALTAEFRPTDSELALARLDELAGELTAQLSGDSRRDVLACRDLIDRAAGFRTTQRFAPEYLMLDAVLEQSTGHPLILAIVYAEVGRRAGVELRPVGAGSTYLVAHIGHDAVVMLDPHERGRIVTAETAPGRLRWLCAHEVGFAVLGELVDAYTMAGDLTRARHAATLRLSLPLGGPMRERVEREIRGLDARLN